MNQTSDSSNKALHIGKPKWLKSKIPTGATYFDIKKDLRNRKLFTVCEEAKCPNIGECWNTNTATFMVLGSVCTRACRFCNVATGNPNGWIDKDEPRQTAESVAAMRLRYVVLTMVDRDDLSDGGASHVSNVLEEVRRLNPEIKIEILAGDFKGSNDALRELAKQKPEVFAHNLETVERLTPRVRDARASYEKSLYVLKTFKAEADYPVFTKSALMLGLGEEEHEVIQSMKDLRNAGVDFITIGQYLRPTKKHLAIKSFVHPDQFEKYKVVAQDLGFLSVASGPLVRSSYRAREFYEKAISG